MKLFKRAGALTVALALAVGCLSGCSSSKTARTTVPESIDLSTVTDPYEAACGLSGDTVVATAGEVEITADQLLYWISYSADNLSQYYSMYGLDTELPWDTETEDGRTLATTMKETALETAVLYALLPQMAQKDGLELSQEYKDSFNASLEQLSTSLGDEEQVNHYLWYFPLTKDVYTHLCDSEEYNSMIMTQRFGEGSEGYPTDDDVLTYLEQDEQCYFFKHILLKVEETTEEGDASSSTSTVTSTYAQQKALAEDLVQQLQASDDPITLFDTLMNQYSEDPGLASYPEGYLGSAKDGSSVASNMVTVVEEACLSLEEGQISGVLENEEGYHGFHIVLRLPVEGNVDLAEYRQTYIADQMSLLQDQWLEENPVTTTAAYDSLDAGVYYQTLNVLRQAISESLSASASSSASGSASASASTDDASADASSADGSAQG